MHRFLGSIGFLRCESVKKEKMLLDEVMHYANKKLMISDPNDENSQLAELSLDFGTDFGITVCGTYDAEDHFHIKHYFPYLNANSVTTSEETFFNRHCASEALGGLCEDYHLGVSMIYFIRNGIELLRNVGPKEHSISVPVKISCLASDGTILLPAMKTSEDVKKAAADHRNQSHMIAEAKGGDQEAIEKLTMREIDTMESIGRRIKNEDLFSVVDTSFIPHGIDSELYRILGIILSCEEHVNALTEQIVYVMDIFCNGLAFSLCINKECLLGEPAVGRRIRAVVWLQGEMVFNE